MVMKLHIVDSRILSHYEQCISNVCELLRSVADLGFEKEGGGGIQTHWGRDRFVQHP